MRNLLMAILLTICASPLFAQKSYTLTSPDGKIVVTIEAGKQLTYSVAQDGETVLFPSQIALRLGDGRTLGENSRVRSARTRSVDETIVAPFYKRAEVTDRCNELTLAFREKFAVVFRAYDDGAAYRFTTDFPADFVVENETAQFEFGKDCKAYIPYVRIKGTLEQQYNNSFENVYTVTPLSGMDPVQLAFSPAIVESAGRKVCIAESDLEHYPGMYLWNPEKKNSLTGTFAPCPDQVEQGGYNRLQGVIRSRKPYIAACAGRTSMPWRTVIVATEDRQLPASDMIYKLAAPSRIGDTSWIKPGKVAWEWWNAMGLKGVDFKTGVNNDTYKAYIDFAAKHGIQYVILDEGWAVNLQADLMQVVPGLDLEELVAYGKDKNVGLILWAGYYAFARDIEGVCAHYSKMGVKGFKVDFMDHDDQQMVDFFYKAAETAARYELILDLHGSYKPTGLNRTYPNVLNFEGVNGQEQMKWSDSSVDQVTYDVMIPFLRMVAGPLDYTQGAMRNATKQNFRPIHTEPMSQGTRCRQLADYVIFDAPLSMLCDSPSAYEQEVECTKFITEIPTEWEQTLVLDGKIGEYIATARLKDNVWYVGALTNWDARTLELDLSFLGDGAFTAELFRDGANADRLASDYKKECIDIPADRKLKVSMAAGGGCALKIVRK